MRLLSLLFTVVVSVVAFAQPAITSLSTYSANVGASVTITGTGFSTTAANNVVYFGSAKASITGTPTTTSIVVTVPAGSTYAPVSVTVGGLTGESRRSFAVSNTSLSNPTQDQNSFTEAISITSSTANNATLGWYASDKLIGVGDFDLDGKTDVVKGGATSIRVHRNTSNSGVINTSSFAAGQTFSTGLSGQSPWSIQVADIDNDGKLDILAGNESQVSIFRNTSTSGSINFATAVNVATSDCSNLRVGDIDGDGKKDILVSASYSSGVNIYLNTSSVGAISFSSTAFTLSGGSGNRHFEIAYINNDNKIDVILPTEDSGIASILCPNTSTSGTISFGTNVSISSANTYGSFNQAIGDFDNDGDNDIYNCYGRVIVNNSTSAINCSVSDQAFFNDYFWMTAGDYTGDGKLDVVTSYSNSGVFIYMYQNSYVNSLTTNLSAIGYSSTNGDPLVCDIDGDNKLDVLVSGNNNALFQIFRNKIGEVIQTHPDPNSVSYCQNSTSTALTSSALGTTLTYQWQSSTSNSSGFTDISGATSSSYTPLTSSVGTLYYRCKIISDGNTLYTNVSGAILVNPNSNTVGSASSTPSLCVNTAMTNITHATTNTTGIGTASGLPSGVTASFANNTITISGTPTVTGTYNYSVPLTGCAAINATGTITVNLNTAGTVSSNPSLCINTALTNITRTTTGATGIGTPSNLPSGVTASWSSNTLTVSGTPTASGVFNYTIPLTGGCGSVNATGTITVTAANTVSAASSTPSLCTGTTMTNITHTSAGATNFGYPSGLPGGMNVTFSSNTLTISGTPSTTYSVGNYYNGGRIAYIFQPGDNGYVPGKVLIIDPVYKTGGICSGGLWTMQSETANTSSALGEGLNNTNNLYAAGHTNTGLAIGYAYAYTDGTYNDWFVPSSEELLKIFTNLPSYTPTISGNLPVRSSTEISGSLGQVHGYRRVSGATNYMAANDGGCAGMIIARYDILPTPTSSNTYNYTIPLTGGCGSVSAAGTITLSTDTYTWTGLTSTNPSVAGNWNPASVPCDGANKIIPTGLTNYPTYTTLNINSGSSFTLQTGARMTVTGLLTNNGTLTVESGATLMFTGGLAGNGSYTVKQNITDCSNDGSAPTGRFWYMGIPLTSMTRANAFGTAGTMNRLWQWSEGSQAWSSQIADNTSLSASNGYVLRLGSNTTLNFTGTNLYNANASWSGLQNNNGSFGGCHLFANSNTAYLDWHAVYGSGVSSTYCVRSYNTTNSQMVYDTYNAVGTVAVQNSSYAVTRYIAPMQSFWIRVNPSTTGSISINKANLSHQPTATGLKEITEFPAFARLNLMDGTFSDQVVVYTDANADAEVEDHDSKKFFLPNVAQVYCKVGNDKLVINALKKGKAQTSAPLTVELPSTKVYKFEMAESFVDNGLVILEDRQEGIFQDMGINPTYEFFGNSGVIADRFVLHFQLPNGVSNEGQAGVEDLTSSQIAVISNQNGSILVSLSADLTATGEVQVLDAAGRLIQTTAIKGQDTKLQITEGTGVYFVRVSTPMKSETKKVLVY